MPVSLIRQASPVIVALPYTGTDIPRFVTDRLHDPARHLSAPDLFLDRLLHSLIQRFTLVRANFHRYLCDVDAVSPQAPRGLQKGMIGVVPLLDDTGAPLWDRPPGSQEAATWRAMYYAPYHAALAAEIARARVKHGFSVVVNIRSLRGASRANASTPRPDVGLSTFMGSSCAVDLGARLGHVLRLHPDYVSATRGRQAAGWTIRHYGRPNLNTHALGLDVNEAQYLRHATNEVLFDKEKADPFRSYLGDALAYLEGWRPKPPG